MRRHLGRHRSTRYCTECVLLAIDEGLTNPRHLHPSGLDETIQQLADAADRPELAAYRSGQRPDEGLSIDGVYAPDASDHAVEHGGSIKKFPDFFRRLHAQLLSGRRP